MLLDPEAEQATRAKLVAEARAAIEAQGQFLRHDEWGNRALSYPIERRTAAEYHLLQFHAGTPQLLSSLDRSLRIADGILRFRIVKLKPGVAEAPDMRASAPAAPAGAGAAAAAPGSTTAQAPRSAAGEPSVAPDADGGAEPAAAQGTEAPAPAQAETPNDAGE